MSVKVRRNRRGDGWEVDIHVRMPDGVRFRERADAPVSSKSAARRWGEQREHQLALHGKTKQKEVPTLEVFVPRYMDEYVKANRQKPSTTIQKQNIFDHYLNPRFGSKRLDAITQADVQKLKSDLLHLSPKTVNNILVVLNTTLKFAVEVEVLPRLPCRAKLVKVEQDVEPKFYEPHEYEQLVTAAAALDPRIELFVLLGGDAGLRCGEIIALEQRDLDLRRGLLKVRRAEWEGHVTVPKGGKGRKVVLTERLKAALAKNRHLRGDRVLWRDDGFPKVSQVLLAKWMRRAQRRAGLKPTGSIHVLRHTFCSRLAMAGASTKAIQELAGHRRIITTERYMHLAPRAKATAIALLDKGADRQAADELDGIAEREDGAVAEQEKEKPRTREDSRP